jgi:UrcA family protein
MMKRVLFILVLASAGATTAKPSQPQSAVRSEQVTYADLNLGKSGAEATLQDRIRAAAGRVCELGAMQSLEDFSASSHCFKRAVADGYGQMNKLIAAKNTGATVAASAIVISAH